MKIKRFVLGELQTNCYIIESEKTFIVIDPGFEDHQLSSYLSSLKKEAKYMVLTHNHYDHISGVPKVKELCPDIVTVMHREDAKNLSNPLLTGESIFSKKIKKISIDIFAEHQQTLAFNGEIIKLYHTPGHTAGSMSIELGNILFTGDVLFKGSVGRTDLPTGNLKNLCSSLDLYYSFEQNYDVYPGHGEYTTLEDEKQTREYFCV